MIINDKRILIVTFDALRPGIVGNRFVDPVAAPGRLFETGVKSQLRDGDKRLGGFRMALHAPEATVGLAPPGQRCKIEDIEKNFRTHPKT
ncbi:MAG: hypothetical protein CMM57_05905 [Rhodospirillaceae bacterium]|nr:hypothetical protein [Rhodospirillaceae bacterium]